MSPEKVKVGIFDANIADSNRVKNALIDAGHTVLGTAQNIGGLERMLLLAVENDTIPDVVLLNNFASTLGEYKGEIIEGCVRRICGDGPVTVAFTENPSEGKPYGQYKLFKSDEAIEKIGKYVNALPGNK